jgi:pimeloyl-ACP methyl ester carboxylesterase
MKKKSVRTKDGVRLNYLEGGDGRPLIMLPGWSQPAAIFKGQFEDFCQIGRVIALDYRGHGDSEKPDHGYKIERLAKDLFEVIETLRLEDPDLVAHSMGAAVAWSYLLLFEREKPLRRLVLIDEPRALLARPDWPEPEREQAGAIVPSLEKLAEYVAGIRKSNSPEAVAAILRPMFTSAIGESDLLEIARENLKFPRNHAAELLADNVIQDWRTVIERIRIPTLVFGGAASVHPPASQKWIADTIPNGQFELIPAGEGGSHFMFFENPARFNARTIRFLTR